MTANRERVARRDTSAHVREADPALRIALARAVAADDTARLLDVDNRCVGWMSMAEAAAGAEAYFVRVASDVLALDADQPGQAGELLEIADRLAAHGYTAVLLRSGGAPHRQHLFARVHDGRLRDMLIASARLARVDVRADIRPPGSVHRSGRRPELLEPLSWPEALLALTDHDPGARRRPLSAGMQRLLVGGLGAYGHYPSTSEAVQAVALSAVNAGWGETDFLEVMSNPRFTLAAEAIAKRGDADHGKLTSWLARSWIKATDYAEAHPAHDPATVITLERLEAAGRARPWPGRTGSSDRAVYLALLEKAQRASAMDVDCSERELEQLALLGSRNTVRAALKRLDDQRLISPVRAGTERWGATWRIEDVSDPHLSHPEIEVCGAGLEAAHDLWRNGAGLGKSPQRVYERLLVEPAIAEDMAASVGLSKRTMDRALERLKVFGLAEKSGRVWRPLAADKDALARDIGVLGKSAAQAARHRREREAHNRLLAAQTQMPASWVDKLVTPQSQRQRRYRV